MIRIFKAFWKNKWQILSGMMNSIGFRSHIEAIASDRLKICQTNQCGLYDPNGAGEICYLKGKPCCLECGCKLAWKVHSLHSSCHKGLWDATFTEEDEEKLRIKYNLPNE